MNISAPFIRRPVATTLLTIAVAIAGAVAFIELPVAPLPQVDFPTISVSASLPGASAQIMASSVATPLERQLGHIAGVSEMTSSSSLGSTSVTLQFDLSRDIDGAARDVEAGINAARTYLPANLPQNPSYRKVNPADAPIMILSLTSDKYDVTYLYDQASTVLEQKLSQIQGVGQVFVGGGATPSVRVEANPTKLESFGLTLSNLQAVLSLQNTLQPRGQISNDMVTADIITNDQISRAKDYKPLIVGYHNGNAVRLSDVADVVNSTQNIRTAGYMDGTKSVTVIIFRQPGANILQTVQRIRSQLPFLQAVVPQGIHFTIVLDRTTTIRASVNDVEMTLIISICLVVIIVFVFLRSVRATSYSGSRGSGVADRNLRRDVFVWVQPRQLVADGADHLHRLRRRRCDRGDGRHFPPSGKRHAAVRRCPEGSTGNRLHRLLHQHFADCSVYSHPDDGRDRRTIVPRVRGHALYGDSGIDGGLADHHTDDVRALAQSSQPRREAQSVLSIEREVLRWHAQRLSAVAAMGVGQLGADADRAGADHRAERHRHHQNPKGILPAAGHRRSGRRRAGTAGRVVSVHELLRTGSW